MNEFHDRLFRGLTLGVVGHDHDGQFSTLERLVELPHSLSSRLLFIPETPLLSRTTRRMQRSKDADHLAIYSDATYPVGPDASGRITYVHVPPVSPLTSANHPL